MFLLTLTHMFRAARLSRILATSALILGLTAGGAPRGLAEEAPHRGGVLTQIQRGEPTTLVPLVDSNTLTRFISAKVLEGLVKFDADFKPQPVLATSWDVSPDGLRYTFKLRPNVTWHDGTPFTSADVRFSLLAYKKVGPRGRITFAALTDVETPDPLTAVAVLSRPTPFLLRALTGGETAILPAHAYPNDDYAASPNGSKPIGTGPFRVEEWKRGSHVLLGRNPTYWQEGLPYLDRVVFRFTGNDSSVASAALETGEGDLTFDAAPQDLERLAKVPGLKINTYFDGYLNNALIFEFNLDNPVLAKKEVRQALAHAIDRTFINDQILYGYGKAAGSTIPAAFPQYNDEAPFNYPFDLAKAAQLLDQAGYPKGADGTRFSLRLTFIPGDVPRRTSEFLRGSFAKLGVKVELRDGDLGTYIRRVYNERGFDINLNGISRLFDPTAGVQRLYWSDGIKNPLPYLNAAHYNNPDVDELFRKAAVEVDETKRAALFKTIQTITGADLPNIAVVALPTILVGKAKLHNIVSTIDVASSDYASAWKEP